MCQTNIICTFSDLYILTFIRDVQEPNSLLKLFSWLLWKGLWVFVKGLVKDLYSFINVRSSALSEAPPLNANIRGFGLFILNRYYYSNHGCLKPLLHFKYNNTAICMHKSLMDTCDMAFDQRRMQSFLIRVVALEIPSTHVIMYEGFNREKILLLY